MPCRSGCTASFANSKRERLSLVASGGPHRPFNVACSRGCISSHRILMPKSRICLLPGPAGSHSWIHSSSEMVEDTRLVSKTSFETILATSNTRARWIDVSGEHAAYHSLRVPEAILSRSILAKQSWRLKSRASWLFFLGSDFIFFAFAQSINNSLLPRLFLFIYHELPVQ